MTKETITEFYRPRKKHSDVYHLEGVTNETVRYLRKNDIYSRDTNKANITPKHSTTSTLASVVVAGDTMSLSEVNNMYVIPFFSVDRTF